jgi:putative FmdB family regulatory protein
MPTYDYRCAKCGVVFEDTAPMSECSTPKVCDCGGSASRAYLRVPAFHGYERSDIVAENDANRDKYFGDAEMSVKLAEHVLQTPREHFDKVKPERKIRVACPSALSN